MKQWFSDTGQQERRTVTPNRLEIDDVSTTVDKRGNPGARPLPPRSPRVEEMDLK